MATRLKALGASATNKKLYQQNAVNEALIERFKNPAETLPSASSIGMWEHIDVPEFTCLCPITGQPDFARIELIYTPDKWCVESKSLKLYLGSFRNVGTFHEAVAHRICNDLADALDPRWLLVIARFTPRGGIPFQPRAWVGNVPTSVLYRL